MPNFGNSHHLLDICGIGGTMLGTVRAVPHLIILSRKEETVIQMRKLSLGKVKKLLKVTGLSSGRSLI